MNTDLTIERMTELIGEAREYSRELAKHKIFLRRADSANYSANVEPGLEGAMKELKHLIQDLEGRRCAKAEARQAERPAAADLEAAVTAAATAAATAALERAANESLNQSIASAAGEPDPALIERARKAAEKAMHRLVESNAKLGTFTATTPVDDDELFQKAEEFKLLESQVQGALADAASKLLACNLLREEEDIENAAGELRDVTAAAQAKLLEWRRAAGIWAEKVARGGNRALLKPPFFSGKPKTLTIYEFIKEWRIYRQDANLSVHEALKELKVAVRDASKAATDSLKTEEAVFEHLKTQYGNVLTLLQAREHEIAGWKECKGTPDFMREWLCHALTRLQNTVELCEEHDIMEFLHDSRIVPHIRVKFTPEMDDKWLDTIEAHCHTNGTGRGGS